MTRATYFGMYCMMLSLLVASGIYVSHTHAQESTSTEDHSNQVGTQNEEGLGVDEETTLERRTVIASSTEEFKERLAEHKTAFAKKIQDRIYNLTQNIRGRMGAAIYRLEHIAGRIETRTDKVDLDEVTKNIVHGHVTDARTSLEDASALLAPDLGLFIQSDKPREKFGDVFNAIKKAGQDIRNAHESLRAALAVLKGTPTDIQAPEDGSATSTEGIRVQ